MTVRVRSGIVPDADDASAATASNTPAAAAPARKRAHAVAFVRRFSHNAAPRPAIGTSTRGRGDRPRRARRFRGLDRQCLHELGRVGGRIRRRDGRRCCRRRWWRRRRDGCEPRALARRCPTGRVDREVVAQLRRARTDLQVRQRHARLRHPAHALVGTEIGHELFRCRHLALDRVAGERAVREQVRDAVGEQVHVGFDAFGRRLAEAEDAQRHPRLRERHRHVDRRAVADLLSTFRGGLRVEHRGHEVRAALRRRSRGRRARRAGAGSRARRPRCPPSSRRP